MGSVADRASGPRGLVPSKRAAAFLGLSEDQVYRMIRRGELAAVARGEKRPHYYVPAAEIERLLAAQDGSGTAAAANTWLAQARTLRESAVKENLEDAATYLAKAVAKLTEAERKLDALGDAR